MSARSRSRRWCAQSSSSLRTAERRHGSAMRSRRSIGARVIGHALSGPRSPRTRFCSRPGALVEGPAKRAEPGGAALALAPPLVGSRDHRGLVPAFAASSAARPRQDAVRGDSAAAWRAPCDSTRWRRALVCEAHRGKQQQHVASHPPRCRVRARPRSRRRARACRGRSSRRPAKRGTGRRRRSGRRRRTPPRRACRSPRVGRPMPAPARPDRAGCAASAAGFVCSDARPRQVRACTFKQCVPPGPA